MLSHANAFTFLDWCDRTPRPLRADDRVRVARAVPFRPVGVRPLRLAAAHAATLVLIGEALGKDPARLGAFLAERRLERLVLGPVDPRPADAVRRARPRRVPGAPARPVRGRGLPDRPAAAAAGALAGRRVLEPLRADRDQRLHRLPSPRRRSPTTAPQPFPIGTVCPPLAGAGGGRDGARRRRRGTLGELVIAGPGVMRGYFGQPDLTAAGVPPRRRRRPPGTAPATWSSTTAPAASPSTAAATGWSRSAATGSSWARSSRPCTATRGSTAPRWSPRPTTPGVTIAAFVAMKPGHKGSIIAMKRHCTIYLPHYMVPDTITFLPDLPTTSTDKVDYQGLKRLAAEPGRSWESAMRAPGSTRAGDVHPTPRPTP